MSRTVGIVTTLLMRDRYLIERHHFLIRTMVACALILMLTAPATISLLFRTSESRFTPIEKDGTFTSYIPLDQSNASLDKVTSWTADAIETAYRFDFVNYRNQLQATQNNMTVAGWENFRDALIDSANIATIKQKKLTSTPTISGPPVLIREGVFNGRYAWKFEIPLRVEYASSAEKMTQNLMITVVVVRHPEYLNPSGLALAQIIAH